MEQILYVIGWLSLYNSASTGGRPTMDACPPSTINNQAIATQRRTIANDGEAFLDTLVSLSRIRETVTRKEKITNKVETVYLKAVQAPIFSSRASFQLGPLKGEMSELEPSIVPRRVIK